MEAESGENPALVGNELGDDHVVGGDSVGGHKEEALRTDLIDLSDFARGDVGKW